MKLNKAWIILDNGRIIDILSARRNFETVFDYAKEIYRFSKLSFSEKLSLAHYTNGKKNIIDMFNQSIPITSHYHSRLYRDLVHSAQSGKIGAKSDRELVKKLSKHQEYVIVGHNPSIEVRKVSNLIVSMGKNGREILEWEQLNVSGVIEKRVQNQ